jgi:hypothetical protein
MRKPCKACEERRAKLAAATKAAFAKINPLIKKVKK